MRRSQRSGRQLLGGKTSGAPLRSPALHSAMRAATSRAGRAPLTTGHLLAAMVAETDSLAAKALALVGVSADALDADQLREVIKKAIGPASPGQAAG